MDFTAYSALSSVALLVTVTPQKFQATAELDPSIKGNQDHTASPYAYSFHHPPNDTAAVSTYCENLHLTLGCHRRREMRLASTVSRPTFVTIGQTPLCDRNGSYLR